MSVPSYLELATLQERYGRTETLSNFGLRVLTSRSPNALAGHRSHVLKKAFNDELSILVIGETEGEVLSVVTKNDAACLEVSVHPDLIKLEGNGLDGGFSGCSDRDWIEKYSGRQPAILEHTTRLLGELGLYSGIVL